MTSGGTHCDGCRKRNSECTCLPERVEATQPICPWCGESYSISKLFFDGSNFQKIPCGCGRTFETEVKTVYVSRSL